MQKILVKFRGKCVKVLKGICKINILQKTKLFEIRIIEIRVEGLS